MLFKQKNKLFYVIFKMDYKDDFFSGTIKAKSKETIDKKLSPKKTFLRKALWLELDGIDEEGNHNNTCHVVKIPSIDIVKIFESKDEYLQYILDMSPEAREGREED